MGRYGHRCKFWRSQSFQAWSAKAQVLDSLGRLTEAAEIMKKVLPFGNAFEVYFYGRTLAGHKKGSIRNIQNGLR